MAYKIKGEITGVQDLLRTLQRFKQAIQNRIIRKATNDGSQIIKKEAKRLAPRGETKLLAQSIAVRVNVYRNKNIVVGIVGPRTGFQKDRSGKRKITALGLKYKARKHNPSKIAHLVERGHKIRNRKGGPILGVVRAHEFMKPAFESTKARVAEKVGERIASELLKEARKL